MDIILKQRLVGAIVLISLGVIFIPMLLTGKGDLSSGNMTSNIPPEPDYQLQKPAIIVPAPLASVNPPKPGSTVEQQQTTNATAPEAGQKSPASAATPAPVTSVANIKQSSPNASQDQASGKKADQTSNSSMTQAAVTKQDMPAKPAPSVPPKPVTPKPAIPKTSPASATPAADKPSVKPAPAVTGWVVQVGSFEQRANANQLRDKLRHKGYAAFVEPRKDSHDKVYRVRVGPELKRPLAESLQKKLLKQEKLKGIVLRYPAQDG